MAECVPFPKVMQIQTTTACGARCRMCPHAESFASWPNGPIDEGLFRSIVTQCVGEPIQRICPYLMAEPLADPHIFERIAFIRQTLPAVEVEISCTAQPMSPKACEQLLAAPISELRISSHGISREDYALLMPGVKYDAAWENLTRFVAAWKQRRPYPLYIVSLFGLLPADREKAIVDYWSHQGIELSRWRVTSRGRQIDLRQFDSPADPTRWTTARQDPPYACRFARDSEWMHILSDGRVTLCCMDYRQEAILGDASRQSLREIWTGEAYTRMRQAIADGASDAALCRECEWYVSRAALGAPAPQPAASKG